MRLLTWFILEELTHYSFQTSWYLNSVFDNTPLNETNQSNGQADETIDQRNVESITPNDAHQQPQGNQTNDLPSNSIRENKQATQLSKEEEDKLSVYLDLGMSINEAREHHKKELEVAELRMKIREHIRLKNSGSVEAANRTNIGPTSRGTGRGGLSYN